MPVNPSPPRPVRRCCLLWAVSVLVATWAPGLVLGQGQYTTRLWRAENGLPVNHVHSVVQSVDGHIWIATAEGVVRFNGLEFEEVSGLASPGTGPSGPYRLFATSDGSVWLADNHGGLHHLEGLGSTEFWPESGGPSPKLVTQVVSLPGGQIILKRGEEIWAVGGQTRSQPDPVPGEYLEALARDLETRAQRGRISPAGAPQVLVDRNGSQWIPNGSLGLTVTSPGGVPRPVTLPNIGTEFEVTELMEDREGNIWVATTLFGLGLFREDRVEVVDVGATKDGSAALAILEDSRGDIWIVNPVGGLDRLKDGVVQHLDLPGEQGGQVVSALYEDRSGGVWVATEDGPIFRWLGWRFVEQFFENEPRRIRTLYQDPDGVLWMGGPNGLLRTSGQQVTPVASESGFPGGEVTTMTGGADGELWLGTADGFVLRNHDGRFQIIGSPSDTGYTRISTILVETPNRVWVTTLGAGLYLFDGTSWHHFGTAEGLPNPKLTSVIADQLGHLWFGSAGGVLRAQRFDLIARTTDPQKPIHWLRMDRAEGLAVRECVGGHNPSAWRGRDGSIWFPTNLGAIRLDPSRTKVNRTPPPVFVHTVKAAGEPLPVEADGIAAGPGKTRLEFEFYGLNFSDPEKVAYRTQLVGYEDSWREVGTRGETSYDAVPPGNYTFKVFALNGDGVMSESPATIGVTVRPNFWETGWFIAQAWLLVVVLAGGIGWLIARRRMKLRLAHLRITHARETERARIARDLHDDLGASLTEISLLAGLSAEMAAGSDFQESLDDLSNRSRAVAQALDEIVWAVNPTEDTFVSLVDYIGGFASEFMDRAGIALRLDVPSNLPDSPMDTTLRHSIFLSVREAFNNIAKHSGASTAWLHVALDKDLLNITIEDDGCGIPEEVLRQGNGLENFRARMESCGGQFDLRARSGGGTVVEFKVPLA